MNRAVVLFCLGALNAVRSESVINGDGDSLTLDNHGPFWEKLIIDGRSENGHRSFNPDPPDSNRNPDQVDRPKLSLREFLETYAKKTHKRPMYYEDDVTQGLDKPTEGEVDDKISLKDNKSKSTSWTLLNVQKHKHPFDDRKGWVSLDPVPWSVSKISKWQSKYKPSSERPWDEHGPISSQRPYMQDHDDDLEFNRPVSITPPNPYLYHRPTESSDRYDTYYDHRDRPRPTPAPTSSSFPRPTAYFGHKVHLETHFPSNSFSSTGRPNNAYAYYQNDKNQPYDDDIITDGMPSNFPPPNPYDSFRRRGTEMEIHSDKHPFNGEGEWILLSTTKGYKSPKSRQRSLKLDDSSTSTSSTNNAPTHPMSLRTSRGVSLTVLPPLKGSNVNMTTSHGGLLQVESTFESVEQAKQKFDKRQHVKTKTKKKRRKGYKKNASTEEDNADDGENSLPQFGDPGAVLAAVGAGMIPATMAMMVPLAMSG